MVTGASGPIGAAIAAALAGEGMVVAVGYRTRAAEAEQVAEDIRAAGRLALAVRIDVTNRDSVDRAVAAVEDAHGAVEVLVSNAGITADGLVAQMSLEQWRAPLEIGLDGTFTLVRRVVPEMMRSRWGRIVAISSVVGLSGSAGQTNYGAAKAGLVGFTRALARELAPRSITANVVAPGPIATPLLEKAGAARVQVITDAVPLRRLGRPEEVGGAVAFLCSDIAAYVTGAVIPVDGGLGMGH